MKNQALVAAKGRKVTVVQDTSGRKFWANELEVAYDQVVEQVGQPGFAQAWLDKRNGRQLEMIRKNMGREAKAGRIKRKKDESRPKPETLLPYVLVQEFAKFKSKLATVEVAQSLLPPDVMDSCSKGDDDYDTLALMFAIFHLAPFELRRVLHIDKIYKSGFARMKMKDGPRRPSHPLIDFLAQDGLQELLTQFDKSRKDGRTSEMKNILQDGDHDMVFIRRCERPSLILQGNMVLHGYRPEWIVLIFFDGAKRVNIASLSVDASLEIANLIASEYYGKKCEYVNESEITYARQLERLLDLLKKDQEEQLAWVEILLGSTPLNGECGMKLSDPESHSIGPAVRQFETAIGSLANLDAIHSIKVLYAKKHVSLIPEKVEGTEDEFVVRYSDHRLIPRERLAFEKYMRSTHAIPVLSTEKRFKRSS